jgi:putative Ca2+/H+ antiporter (TMEM165/GDT1 family)
LEAFLISFGVIFVAELGDKSQLMALTFATRYRAVPVLIGIATATALVHAVSVIVGAVLGAALPLRLISIVGGLAFLGFAVWTLRGDELTDDEKSKVDQSSKGAIVAVGVAFFFAELGDKTMLATVTLASTNGLFGTWLGSTLGMIASDALAIVVGRQLGTRLPERAVRIGAAILFALFGVVLLVEAFTSS